MDKALVKIIESPEDNPSVTGTNTCRGSHHRRM